VLVLIGAIGGVEGAGDGIERVGGDGRARGRGVVVVGVTVVVAHDSEEGGSTGGRRESTDEGSEAGGRGETRARGQASPGSEAGSEVVGVKGDV